METVNNTSLLITQYTMVSGLKTKCLDMVIGNCRLVKITVANGLIIP